MSKIEYHHYGRCFECGDLTGLNVKSLMCPKHDYLAKIQKLEARLKEIESKISEVAGLVLTTGYTEKDGLRIMDKNEYQWLDVAANILRPYFSKQEIKKLDTL